MPPATVRFRWRFATGFSSRTSREFEAASPPELFSRARACLPDLASAGLVGVITLEARCAYSHDRMRVPEWRRVGPEALPSDHEAAVRALLVYRGRAFREALALSDDADAGV